MSEKKEIHRSMFLKRLLIFSGTSIKNTYVSTRTRTRWYCGIPEYQRCDNKNVIFLNLWPISGVNQNIDQHLLNVIRVLNETT